ncbi:TonB-dependent siderophore receptor [Sphingomonas sp.]|uniref:TonB-dependent siderophore receptor n=1 Tax=Sphingomonas sp. TaxID=28214 RepID=UPI001B1A3065|nr:TonB-dependent siderophore receptor [Sphingomonas sp.]MBO9714603.1 TonB-dependent siderophore receptor [Sphingomonas sp.]
MKQVDHGPSRGLLAASALALAIACATPAWAADGPEGGQDEVQASASDEIIVTGINAPVTTSTGLPLKFMETPQSVTIIDQKRIQDYALTSIKDLLDQAVGVNVERAETDRTTFNARGFDVTNFQIDGIGLPLIQNYAYGDTDSFLYERIDIIRGANGLTTGIGNPSATINYVRKRPSDTLHANASAYFGSWNKWRVEGDVSVPIGDDWGIRVIGAHEESDSYLDRYNYNRDVIGIVLSGRITPNLTLTAGYNRQDHDSQAASWIGLWLYYSDGTPINYARSANSAPRWATWPTTEHQAYGELAYALGSDWTIKGVLTYRNYLDAPRILNPSLPPDKATGFYLADTSEFETNNNRVLGDLYASGVVRAFGQEHKLTFGLSYAHSHQLQYQGRAVDTGFGLGAVVFPDFNGPNRWDIPLPTYNPKALAQDQTDKLLRAYAASQINFTDRLHLVAGASWARLDSSGFNYGQVVDTSRSKLNPYAGVLFDLTSFLTAYASYTSIFMPQVEYDVNHVQLKPVEGTNMEAGLKANLLDKRLYLSATVFKTQQNGLASYVSQVPDPVYGTFFAYEGVDTTAKGFEFEVAGRITPNWDVSGGFTTLSLKDQAGADTRLFIPRQSIKASTTYTIPALNKLSFGAQLRWQSKVDTITTVQPAYAVLDLMAGVDVVDNIRASIVVRNVTDKLYYASLVYGVYGISQYAAPRSFTASLSYRF